MKKLLLIFLLFSSYCFGQTVPIAKTIPNAIPYMLPADENVVSKGIYTGGVLVRTLESNKKEAAGWHTAFWDGYDDEGNLQTTGANFQLKVAYNNDVFTWAGTVGNSSTLDTGFHILKGGSQIGAMFYTGTTMRRATGFCEGVCSQSKAPMSAPQQRATWSNQPKALGQGSFFGCANGKWMFWGGDDYRHTKSFVFVERVSDETEKTFSGSTTFIPPLGRNYAALDINTADIGGMTVQQGGNMFLYVSHPTANTIDISKTADSTGTTHTVSIVNTGPIYLDTDNFLWVAQGTVLAKYSVNATTGDLTSTGVQITGFSNIRSVHIQSGDIAVLDGGTQDVCKQYNSTTLALTRTTGIVGGYSVNPNVVNNRFYLNDLRGDLYTYVAHDPSGGLWIGDPGNCRSQHFDNAGNYVESVQYLATYISYTNGTNSGNYDVNICGNQNTSVFCDLREYNIDYTQPLATGWSLIKNWGYNLPVGWQNTGTVEGVYKYPNGRTYAIISQAGTANTYMAELTSTGLRVITSKLLPQFFCQFDKNGDLTNFNATNTRSPATAPAVLMYQKYAISFDSSNNEVIGSPTPIAVIPTGYQDPLPQDRRIYVTASKQIIVFDPTTSISRNLSFPNYYHLAAYDSATVARKWRTGIGTTPSYKGDMLRDGIFDVGNGVIYPGNNCDVSGNSIYYGRHDENWKGSENGLFYKYNDIGLLQGMFGVIGQQIVSGSAPYGFASNSLAIHVTSALGNDYIYTNDESQHNGFHQWKITNTGSEGVQTVNFQLTNRTYTVQNNIIDYLINVPGGQSSTAGITGFSQLPATDVRYVSSPFTNGQFYTVTGTHNFYPNLSHDVHLFANNATGTRYWKANLNVPAQWTLWGQLDLTHNTMVSLEGSTVLNYIAITDNTGKDIARVYLYRTNRINVNGTWLGPFTNPVYGASDFVVQRVQGTNNIYLTMDMWGQKAVYTGPMYDVTADITHPSTFGVYIQNLNVGFDIGINKLYSPL